MTAMTDLSPNASANGEIANLVAECAVRTLAATGVRVEFRQDWTFSPVEWPKKRRRQGGLLRPVGKLARLALRFAWRRATRDLNLGHMNGKGILEPSTGRFMIDFGSFAQIHTDDKTFGGRSGRCLETLDPFPTPGNTADMLWVLRLLRGVTHATEDGTQELHGTSCTRMTAEADLAKASATTDGGLRSPSVGRFEQLRALPVTVWIDGDHIRRVEFQDPGSQHLALELWDYGLATDEFDWSRLPTFRSPDENAFYAGEDAPWHRRLRRRLRQRRRRGR
jgi:hypothetical protein